MSQVQEKQFVVVVDGDVVGEYSTKKSAQRKVKQLDGDAQWYDRAELRSNDAELVTAEEQEAQYAEEVAEQERNEKLSDEDIAFLEEQATNGLSVEAAMADELAGVGDGFTDEQRENFFADEALAKGEISSAQHSRIAKGKLTVAEAKAENEAAIASSDPTPKKEKRANGNGENKRRTRKKASSESGKTTEGGTPTPGLDFDLSDANKYTRVLTDGAVVLETNPTTRLAWIERAANEQTKDILGRRNWAIEVRNVNEAGTLIESVQQIIAENSELKSPKPTTRAMNTNLAKLQEVVDKIFATQK